MYINIQKYIYFY